MTADRTSSSRLRWLNSIHVHMLALSMGVIAAMTAISLILLFMFREPSRPPLSVYEMARAVRGLPLVTPPGRLETGRAAQIPVPRDRAEQVVSALLAAHLGLPRDAVRVTLDDDDRERGAGIAREAALYGPERYADPLILGSFTIAIRDGDGWRTITRRSRGPYFWYFSGWNAVLIGVIMVLPLTLWFSARLARPIEAFAASAQRLRGGQAIAPVTIAGPTEIRTAARSLNEMQARISHFVRERTTLMGAIAHDLRAPLARLHFHLDAADPAVRRAAEGEIREMERLIGVILEFVENETRPQVHEPLDLAMLVEGVADDFADVGKDVRLTGADPVTTTGDPLLLKRLLVNIVDNAVKYGGGAEIGLRRVGSDAVVEVADRGPGMNEEEVARAFEPFFRGEPSRNRTTGGVGLGLAIVKAAADAHGATVELANAPAGGLVAKVSLPIRSPAPAKAVPA